MNIQRPTLPFIFAPLFLLALAQGVAGCGAKTFTGELAELNNRLQSADAAAMRVDLDEIEDRNLRELRERALESLNAAEINFGYAENAWKGRDNPVTREFARVGLIYYNAADSYARSAEARIRLTDANIREQQQRERRNEYDDRLRAETELITLLETVVQLFEHNEALRREIATMESQYQAESLAIYAIQEARVLQREADGVKAPQFAREGYTDAATSLARAVQYQNQGDFERAHETALRSMEEFRLSIEAARPSFMNEQDRVLSNPENQALYDAAQREFGAELAFVDARGIVIVLPGLFDRGQSNIKSDRAHLLDMVYEFVRQNSRRNILIEGHTQDRGEAPTNMTLSSARADAVQNWFLQKSVRSSRMSTAAFGEEAPRFNNQTEGGRADNDRVEIVFLVN